MKAAVKTAAATRFRIFVGTNFCTWSGSSAQSGFRSAQAYTYGGRATIATRRAPVCYAPGFHPDGGDMKRVAVGSLAALLLTASALSAAQEFPSKPVHVVVPFPPGGSLDISGRLIGNELQDLWGQSVVVENKPGSIIGPDYVAKSAPDGYTLMIISSTPLLTLPHLQKVPYDVLKDLAGVTQTTLLTYALVVNPDAGIRSIQELIERS